MNKQLDVLFVHANASEVLFQDLSRDFSAREPPIWAAMLANHCRLNGFGVAILDCEVEQLTTFESAKKIFEHDARLVVFPVYGQNPNASSQNMEGSVATAEAVKQLNPNQKILFVGGHVAALPKETLVETSVDMICQNEGVYTIGNLLKVNLDDEYQLGKVKGLAFKDKEGNFNFNPMERIVPMDRLDVDLPGMAWDLLPDLKNYRTSNWHSWPNKNIKQPFASMYTNVGCYAQCSFCMINIINRTDSSDNITAADSNVLRWWSPDFIIKQFDYLAKMGVKNLKLADELFLARKQHFLPVLKLLEERKHDFNIWLYSRVDVLRPEYLDLMQKVGVTYVALGVEQPDQKLRQEIDKGTYKEVKVTELFKLIRESGINTIANYIFGLPFDTHESMKYTLDFALENYTEMFNLYVAQALPGSPLHLEAKRAGWKLPDRYAGYSQHSYYTQNIPSLHLSAAEILDARDKAFTAYFTNPKYLDFMANKFGEDCVRNIRDMTKIKLKRKLLGD